MLLLISPAKTLDFDEAGPAPYTQPRMLNRSQELVELLKSKSEDALMELMSISEDLAELNYKRYQSFSTPFTPRKCQAGSAYF